MNAVAKILFVLYIITMCVVGWAFCTGCAFPDVSKIDLADCTKQCNASSKVCFSAANEAATGCLTPDASNYERNTCVNQQVTTAESCINNLVACESECVEETQRQLGGK